ncbi:MAG: ABC transporter permease [Caldilineaceae bacterium]
MLTYIVRRILYMIPTLFIISMISFAIIELPPGDYLTAYMANLASSGTQATQDQIASLKQLYGLDQPVYIRYFKWIWRLLQGDMGISFEWNRPVADLIWERLAYTFAISLFTIFFIWLMAFPIGIYSAVRQYSPLDYLYGHLVYRAGAAQLYDALRPALGGLFLLGVALTGLFSAEYTEAPWSYHRNLSICSNISGCRWSS